jgi:hypothetical protein
VVLHGGGGRDFVLNQGLTAFPWAVWQLLHAIITILERLQHQNESSVIRLQKPSQPHIQCVKGKGVPLQARCGPEGSRRFSLPDLHNIPHSMGTSGIFSRGKVATAYQARCTISNVKLRSKIFNTMNETVHFHIYDDEGLKMAKNSLNMLPKQYTLLKIHKIKFLC